MATILNQKKSSFILILLLLMTIALPVLADSSPTELLVADENRTDNQTESAQIQPDMIVKGKVIEVISEEEVPDPLSGETTTNQLLKVRITSGAYKGKIIKVQNMQTSNPVYNIKVKAGNSVLVVLELGVNGSINNAFVADHLREPKIYLLTIIFIILLLAIGWRQGAKSLAALFLTMVLIWGALLPGLLRGYNPILLTVLIAAVATAITLIVIGGWSQKSLAAICGTVGGVTVAGLLALIVGKAAHLTGFGCEEAGMLLYIPNIKLDIQGLLYASIIIGTLGAAMDVSISIASSIYEVKRVNNQLNVSQLITAGMNVGRDIMGTMTNTLILAYTGSSVQLILIFMAYKESLLKILNLDLVASEIVRALAGSIGMVMVVPITAVIAGLLMGNKNQVEEQEIEDNAKMNTLPKITKKH
ncbi:MAG TPA: YibE/F family protein [Bacillota bacterium]|nr:YibE/F family protein [Bacillota bacterium]HOL11103.1 YibE/F family protein [Bacillota bacterium]HPO98826.1 YibE/F family protein [Bacillota bacterium]